MLHDTLGRIITSLRVSLTDRCNLRCRYCMPEEGVTFVPHAEILRYEEIERIIRVGVTLGIVKVRLTGGEPLVRKGAVEFAGRLGRMPELRTVSMTTNGVLLPHYAASLKEAGIGYLNVSLDTLNHEKFHKITRCDCLDQTLAGIRAAKDAGFGLVKVNVVAVRGFNDDELFDFVAFADDYDVTVRFIEYMPFAGNEWQRTGCISAQELKERMAEHYTLIPVQGEPSAPARIYAIPNHRGRIGFIASVTESFCEQCNRLRLTADGHLRPCLHGNSEINIKHPLRCGASDEELAQFFQDAVDKKPKSHQDFLDNLYHSPSCDREMVRIGG